MKKYSQFIICINSNSFSTRQKYQNIRTRLSKYIKDDAQEICWIPMETAEYDYIHELAEKYAFDVEKENDIGKCPELYIEETGSFEFRYSTKDMSDAVAYVIGGMGCVSHYEDVPIFEAFDDCCENSSWKYVSGMVQRRSYRIPPGEFKKKSYGNLMPGVAVGKSLADLLIEHRLASKEDFREIYNKKRDKIVAYQIIPQYVFEGFATDSELILVDECANCGLRRYEEIQEPYFLSEERVKHLHHLSRTEEVTGPIIEGYQKIGTNPMEYCSYVEPWIIVTKEVYDLLHKNYPRMKFEPIFKKTNGFES